MTYQKAMDYLESADRFRIVPGLDSIKELCRRLGNPQDALQFVHVAGTNGKGSLTAYVSSILKEEGYKTGRFVSPAVFEFREQIQINGRPVTKKALCEGVEVLKNACDSMTKEGFAHPTYFEMITALAFWYFEKQGCDIVVLETGMGGLLDATNLITSVKAAVLTPISMDHMKFLGNTLGEIAAQKAGIIKEGCQVITAGQKKEAMEVICRTAEEKGCELTVADVDSAVHIRYGIEKQRFDFAGYKNLEISLAGTCQITNAALAVETVKTLGKCGFPVKETALRKGLKQTVWPGRFTVVGKKPWFIVDGAHNEDAAVKLAQSLEFYFPGKRMIFIMGVLRDKEHEKMVALTHRFADQIITVTPPENQRAMSAYELAEEIAGVHPDVTAADSLEEAVEMSRLLAGKDDVILAFGSLSYLGRLIRIAEKQ